MLSILTKPAEAPNPSSASMVPSSPPDNKPIDLSSFQDHSTSNNPAETETIHQSAIGTSVFSLKTKREKSSNPQKDTKSNANKSSGNDVELVIHGSPSYYNLVFGLIQMFNDIDINGDGTMEWAELL